MYCPGSGDLPTCLSLMTPPRHLALTLRKQELGASPGTRTLQKVHLGGLGLLWLANPCSFGCWASWLHGVEGQFAMEVCICSRPDRLGEEGVNVF
jgi:hypothetical protein